MQTIEGADSGDATVGDEVEWKVFYATDEMHFGEVLENETLLYIETPQEPAKRASSLLVFTALKINPHQ